MNNPNTKPTTYSNNMEYRSFLRSVFQMKPRLNTELDDNHYANTDDLETKDEFDYDDESASKFLDSIYEKTKHIPEFQTLFDLAAACMFSTDREIGLTVLFSYDYLALFYQILESFLQPSQLEDITKSPAYQQLLQGLSRS